MNGLILIILRPFQDFCLAHGDMLLDEAGFCEFLLASSIRLILNSLLIASTHISDHSTNFLLSLVDKAPSVALS
jgi:hypothetical protein